MDENIDQYKRLVYKCVNSVWVRRYIHHLTEHDDLVQEGFIALLHAFRNYNPKHPSKAKFLTYARQCILTRLMKQSNSFHLIRIPIRLLASPKYRKEYPIGVEAAQKVFSVASLPEDFDKAGIEIDESDYTPLYKAIDKLPQEDQQLIYKRYFQMQEPKTIAENYKLTKSRMRQKIQKVRKKLKLLLTSI